jgi:hypothetical protein
VDDPSLHEPDTTNCWVPPGASVTDEGLRTSAVSVGVAEGGGGSGAFGPTATSAVSEGTQLHVATRRKAPTMERTQYRASVAIVAPLALRVTVYQ